MNIVKIAFQSKDELVKSYIPQFKFGGIFINGKFDYQIGDEVFVIITLLEDSDTIAVNATVSWFSPESAVGYSSGIGVQFHQDKAGLAAKSQLEILLGGLLQNRMASYTF